MTLTRGGREFTWRVERYGYRLRSLPAATPRHRPGGQDLALGCGGPCRIEPDTQFDWSPGSRTVAGIECRSDRQTLGTMVRHD
jgi:hypothetical protein